MFHQLAKHNGVPQMVVALLLPCMLHAQTEEIAAKANAAMTSSKEGRHEDSYRAWTDLLSMGVARLGNEGYSFVRGHIYHAAMMKVAEIGDGNCANTLEWVEKGKQPGPPDYTYEYDVFYPALLIAEGVCYAQQERYEEAYTKLILAKSELGKASPEEAAEFLRPADQYLAAIRQHVMSEGDYITNKGVLQRWIGRVVRRNGDTLQVHITYVSKDLVSGLTKGSESSFAAADCKKLGAVSADAVLRGWKE